MKSAENEPPDLRAIITGVPPLRDVPFESWQITPLAGLTNRSFRLRAHEHGRDYALRIAGTGTDRYIARAAEVHNVAAAAAAGLAPPYVYGDAATGLLVTQFIADSRPMSAQDFRSEDSVGVAAQLLRRLHDSGVAFQGAVEPLAVVDRYLAIAGHERIAQLRRAAEASGQELQKLVDPSRPCHVDPSPRNILVSRSRGLMLVDWEYSAMADPVWDLAVVAIEAGLDRADEDTLLRSYDGRIDARRRRKLDLYKPLLRLVGAAWANAAIASGGAAPGLASTIAPAVDALEREWRWGPETPRTKSSITKNNISCVYRLVP